MQLTRYTQEQIATLSGRRSPHEACGIVLNDEGQTVVELNNAALDPRKSFQCEILYEPHEILCVWHSHANDSEDFSKQDILSCRDLGFPYYLHCVQSGRCYWYDPYAVVPLLEREWKIYQNCSTLWRDYFAIELGITFDDYVMESEDQTFDPSFDPIATVQPELQGFRLVASDAHGFEFRKHDVLTLLLHGQHKACHIGIIVDPEKMLMLHHLYGRLSELSVYGGAWISRTEGIWRHHTML